MQCARATTKRMKRSGWSYLRGGGFFLVYVRMPEPPVSWPLGQFHGLLGKYGGLFALVCGLGAPRHCSARTRLLGLKGGSFTSMMGVIYLYGVG